MNAEELRAHQAPIKSKYREQPESAVVTLTAVGTLAPDQLTCNVPGSAGLITAGLHPAAGGDGQAACSGDMLLQALVACSGVTLAAVATAMSIDLQSAYVRAEGEVDFRGTLGVDRDTAVGMTDLRLVFSLESTADDAVLNKLIELTERYCVVLQTLLTPARLETSWSRV